MTLKIRQSVIRTIGTLLLCAGVTAVLAGGAANGAAANPARVAVKFALAGAVPAAAAPAATNDDAAVGQADKAFVAAAGAGDKAALGKMLDGDFSWTNVEGKTLTRAEALQDLPKLLTGGSGGAQVTARSYGDVALVRTDDGLVHVLRIWVARPAGWKLMVYQEVRSLAAAPTVTPSPGKDCENPCRNVLYEAKNDAERGVLGSYMGIESASVAHDAPHWGPHVAEEFVAASSYSNKLLTKSERMADLAKSQMFGLAPTPVVTMRLVDFGDTVVMQSKQQPDHGKPLHITRVFTKRDGNWLLVIAFQTAMQAESAKS